MNKLLAGTALGTLAILAMADDAQAGFINSFGWVSTEAIVSSATGASTASLLLPTCNVTAACTHANADVTFTTNGIDFAVDPATSLNIGDNTAGNGWLGSNPNPKSGLAFHDGVTQATAMDPTLWEFTGTASFTNGQKFTFRHDDGVTMLVSSLLAPVVNEPGPTSPVTSTGTYTGDTGNFKFDIVYAECCGGPQVLQTTLVGPLVPTPEPASLALLGSALAGLGAVARRRRKTR